MMAFSSFLSLAIVATASHSAQAYSSLSSCLSSVGLFCFPFRTGFGFSTHASAVVATAAASYVLTDVAAAAAGRTKLPSSSHSLRHDIPSQVSSFFLRGWAAAVASSSIAAPPGPTYHFRRSRVFTTPARLPASTTPCPAVSPSAGSAAADIPSAPPALVASARPAPSPPTFWIALFSTAPAEDIVDLCPLLASVQRSSPVLRGSDGTSGHSTGRWCRAYARSSTRSVRRKISLDNGRRGREVLRGRAGKATTVMFIDVHTPMRKKEGRASSPVYACSPAAIIAASQVVVCQTRDVKTLPQKHSQQHRARLLAAKQHLILLDAPAGYQPVNKGAVLLRRVLRLVISRQQQAVSLRQVQHTVQQEQGGWGIDRQAQMNVLKPAVAPATHKSRRFFLWCATCFTPFCCSASRRRCPTDAVVKYAVAALREWHAAPNAAAFFAKGDCRLYGLSPYFRAKCWPLDIISSPRQKVLRAATLSRLECAASRHLLLPATCCDLRPVAGTCLAALCQRQQQQQWRSGWSLETRRNWMHCCLSNQQTDAVNSSRNSCCSRLSNTLYSNTVTSSAAPLAMCAIQRRTTWTPEDGGTGAAATFATCAVLPSPAVTRVPSATLATVCSAVVYSDCGASLLLSRRDFACPQSFHNGFFEVPSVRKLRVSSANRRSGLVVSALQQNAAVSRAVRRTQCNAALLPIRRLAYSSPRLFSVGTVLLWRSNGVAPAADLSDGLLTAFPTSALPFSTSSACPSAPADGTLIPTSSVSAAAAAARDSAASPLPHTIDMPLISANGETAGSPSESTAFPPETVAQFYVARRREARKQRSGDRVSSQRQKRAKRVQTICRRVERWQKTSTRHARLVSQRRSSRRVTAAAASAATTDGRPVIGSSGALSVYAAAAAARCGRRSSCSVVGALWRNCTLQERKMQPERGRAYTASSLSARSAPHAAVLGGSTRRSSSSPGGGLGSYAAAGTPRQLRERQETMQRRHLQQRQSDGSGKREDKDEQKRNRIQQQQPAADALQHEKQSATRAARLWLNVNTLSECTGGAAGDSGDVGVRGATRDRTRDQGKEGKNQGREWYLRLMSFNLLADSLTDYKYGALDQNIVRWPNREKAIREEILRHRPDIGCMQEVDRNYYWHRFKSFLQASGYESLYKQKTNGREDGLSTFWLKSRFEVLERRELELSSFPDQRFGAKPQVALLLLLRERIPSVSYNCSDSGSSGGGRETTCSSDFGRCNHGKSNTRPGASSGATGSQLVQQDELSADEKTNTRAGETRKGETRRSVIPDGCTSHASSTGLLRSRSAVAGSSERKVPQHGIREISGTLEKRLPRAAPCATPPVIGRILIVANTHLLFDSRRGDIKLAQLLQLLSGVQEMRRGAVYRLQQELRSLPYVSDTSTPAFQYGHTRSSGSGVSMTGEANRRSAHRRTPSKAGQAREEGVATAERLVDVLLCGDFNFTPHSPLYQLLLQGVFDFRGLDPKKLSGQFLMERRAYKVDAEGYHGRGSTIVSSPAESQRLSAVNSKMPWTTNSATSNSLQHCWSTRATAHVPLRSQQHAAGPLQPQQQREDRVHPSQQSGPLYSSTTSPVGDIRSSSLQWLWEVGQVFLDGTESADRKVAMPTAHLVAASDCLSSATAATTEECKDTTFSPFKRPIFASPCVIQLPFRFRSAYALPRRRQEGVAASRDEECDSGNVAMEEPAFTAYHGWQKGCIDYVFYSSQELKVGYVYQFPPLPNAIKYGCCPNKLWPCSDHYSLVVDLVRTE